MRSCRLRTQGLPQLLSRARGIPSGRPQCEFLLQDPRPHPASEKGPGKGVGGGTPIPQVSPAPSKHAFLSKSLTALHNLTFTFVSHNICPVVLFHPPPFSPRAIMIDSPFPEDTEIPYLLSLFPCVATFQGLAQIPSSPEAFDFPDRVNLSCLQEPPTILCSSASALPRGCFC